MVYLITLLIIIIGKVGLFDPEPSLENCASFVPVSTSLEFATIVLLQSQVVSLCIYVA
jgi:hypothetical protein